MIAPQDFPFKTRPYTHQFDCWNISKDRLNYALFLEMGAGKSKIILDTAAHLILTGKINATVVVAPKAVYRNWVDNEIPTHFPEVVKYKVAYWSSYARKKERDEMAELLAPGPFHRIFVINVEAMASTKAVTALKEFLQKFKCLLVIDESTTIKNPEAKRTKLLTVLGKYAQYKRIVTGNPIPNGPLDLYSQAAFLGPDTIGYTNYYAFRNRFAIMVEQKMGSASFKKVVGYQDLDHLQELMRKFAFIIKKKDCLDLPPKVYSVLDVEMGPLQTKAYNEMYESSYLMLSDESQVSAPLVITQLMKLHQIACGFIKPDHGTERSFDEPNARLETLLEAMEQAPGKGIIWANYRYNIKQLMAAIKEKFGEDSVVDYYGDTSDDDRQAAKRVFQDPTSTVRWIVSNPSTGKWGNTWTQATTVFYYSNSYDLESREQSEDRAHRIGQVGAIHKPGDDPSVLYVDLRVRGTVDDKIIKTLKNKKSLTDAIVVSNWQWLLGEKAA